VDGRDNCIYIRVEQGGGLFVFAFALGGGAALLAASWVVSISWWPVDGDERGGGPRRGFWEAGDPTHLVVFVLLRRRLSGPSWAYLR